MPVRGRFVINLCTPEELELWRNLIEQSNGDIVELSFENSLANSFQRDNPDFVTAWHVKLGEPTPALVNRLGNNILFYVPGVLAQISQSINAAKEAARKDSEFDWGAVALGASSPNIAAYVTEIWFDKYL